MAGFEASREESDFGFSLPHLLTVGVLLAGIGLAVGISHFQTKPSPSPPVKVKSLAAKSSLPPATRSPAADLSRSSKATPALEPAVAERSAQPRTISHPPIVAAIAEKPSAVIEPAEEPLPESLRLTESELELNLRQSIPTVGLTLKQAAKAHERIRSDESTRRVLDQPDREVLAVLKDSSINGLPFAEKGDCALTDSESRSLDRFSAMLHNQIRAIDREARNPRSSVSSTSSSSQFHVSHRDSAVAYAVRYNEDITEKAIPALVQILQVEPELVREQLVETLAEHSKPEATRALVDRAVFDLSPVVRKYASSALKNRPSQEYRPELLKALRYPWSPVAWHAAETLVAVGDEEAVPELIKLLDAPDPAKPFLDSSGQLMVRELVRLNHFQNCLLCHAPSHARTDLAAGPVPTPGREIRPAYYGSFRRPNDVFVRADVTYLRQDFSVMHDVADANPWPERQRFDYLVRTREATAKEIADLASASSEDAEQYPQRDAVLFALRKLTGKNLGQRSEDWRALKF